MIRNEKEYQEAKRRLNADLEFMNAERQALREEGRSEEEIKTALEPAVSFHLQLREEVEWYERVLQRDFGILSSIDRLGQLLIALRIANGVTQKELAERLGVSEAQVSRDERNEYHGITIERAQRIVSAFNEEINISVSERPPELVGTRGQTLASA